MASPIENKCLLRFRSSRFFIHDVHFSIPKILLTIDCEQSLGQNGLPPPHIMFCINKCLVCSERLNIIALQTITVNLVTPCR